MARETGLEPATSAVTGRRSNHLNCSRGQGGWGETRTPDPLGVNEMLYQLS